MCVIAVKPKKTRIAYKTVEAMFEDNSDGAGMAIVHKEKTHIFKGYTDLGDMWSDILQVQDEKLVLHFRVRTHGKVTQEQTHPFILDPDVNIASALATVTDKPVLFHNGILHEYGDANISDTLDFVTSTLAHIPTLAARVMLLRQLSGSKFVLIEEGEVYYCGNFTKHKGLQCSNTFFDKYWRNNEYRGNHANRTYGTPGAVSDGANDTPKETVVLPRLSYSHTSGDAYDRRIQEAVDEAYDDFYSLDGNTGILHVGAEHSDPGGHCGNIGKRDPESFQTPLSLISKKLQGSE